MHYSPYQTEQGPMVDLPLFNTVEQAAEYYQSVQASLQNGPYNQCHHGLGPVADGQNRTQHEPASPAASYMGYGLLPYHSEENTDYPTTEQMEEDLGPLSPPVKPWLVADAVAEMQDIGRIRRVSNSPSI